MQIFLPGAPQIPDKDRGRSLQEQFGNLGSSTTDATPTFQDYYEDEENGVRPSMIYSPVMVESGAPLLISNLDLRGARGEASDENEEAIEFFDLFPHSRKSFTLASAARMSATFPYVSPAVSLPTIPRRRIVDAGYYDGYGLNLLASFLLDTAVRDWIRENTSGVAVLELWDGPRQPSMQVKHWFKRVFQFITTPIEGFLPPDQPPWCFATISLCDWRKRCMGRKTMGLSGPTEFAIWKRRYP